MSRRKPLERGSKGLLYINSGVSDGLLEFINTQSELNGVLLLGLKRLADEYGNVDLIRLLPRTYELENEGFNIQPTSKNALPVQTTTNVKPSITQPSIPSSPATNVPVQDKSNNVPSDKNDQLSMEELQKQIAILQQQIAITSQSGATSTNVTDGTEIQNDNTSKLSSKDDKDSNDINGFSSMEVDPY